MTASGNGERQWLGRLGEAFGDATRRHIYHFVVESAESPAAAEVAVEFGIHRTVARSHLEKLVETGLLQVASRRHAKGGRPAKIYLPAEERFEVIVPPRRFQALATLCLQAMTRLPADVGIEALARDVGRAYGSGLARSVWGEPADGTARRSLEPAVRWLDDAGYRARLEDGNDGKTVLAIANCVYRETADIAPGIVCSFDSGMLCGLVGASDDQHTQTASIVGDSDVCRHEFRL
jgi:predicted ArsR family transcriptional regulator